MCIRDRVDMLPLFGTNDVSKEDFDQLIADELGVSKEDIYGKDLYLYNRAEGTVWGAKEEFISSPHLDDMQCAFATLKGFLSGYHEKSVNVYACFDNEEVGSVTKQGAGSTFLYDVLRRINGALGKTEEDYYRAVSGSFMAVSYTHLARDKLGSRKGKSPDLQLRSQNVC